MDTLEVIARPHFEKADLAWLTDIRSRRAGSRGPPYFTLVFHGTEMEPAAFVEQVRTLAAGIPRIRFRLRCALVAPEPLVGRHHVFLVPDEGFGAISRLYDALHVGDIEVGLRFDSAYLPHITVATTDDYAAARKLAQALNLGGIDISGHIDALEVERRNGDIVRKVAEIPLVKTGWFG